VERREQQGKEKQTRPSLCMGLLLNSFSTFHYQKIKIKTKKKRSRQATANSSSSSSFGVWIYWRKQRRAAV
jgi:hypothetical protein